MSKGDILRVQDYLEHIVEAIWRIHTYVEDLDEVGFSADRKTQDAVIRNFEVIGEASNNIRKYHPAFFARHPSIPFGPAYEMRNALAHGYFKIDIGTVWNTIHDDFPLLAEQIEQVLAQEYPNEFKRN